MALKKVTEGLIGEREKLFSPSLDDEINSLLTSMYSGKPAIPAGDPSSLYIPVPRERRNIERYVGQTYDPTMPGLEDYAASQQTAFNRWAGFVPRVGVKVASEMLQLPGYAVGLVDWATTGFQPEEIGRMVDNAWIQSIQDVEAQVKDKAFPVYIPDSVKDGNLWDNITSASFWATEGADAIGFLAAMLVPGQVIKASNIGAKMARIFGKGLAFEGKVDTAAATIVNTLYESAAEGGETYREVLRETGSKELAGEAAADVTRKNMLILLGPNAVQQALLFNSLKRGKQVASSAGRAIKNKALGRVLDPQTHTILAEIAPKSKWAKSVIIGKKALTGLVSEGFFEEGLQFATSEAAKEKITSGEEFGFFEDVWNVLETYADHISDTEMQKNIFLGAFLGTTMGVIGGVRDIKQEERLLKGQVAKKPSAFGRFLGQQERKETVGLHELLRRNYINRPKTMRDLAKTDENGEPTVNETTGKYELDPRKVKEAGQSAVESMIKNKQLSDFSEANDEESFHNLKNEIDFEYMLLFLEQEGGLEILQGAHIENLSEQDAANAKDNGFLLQDGAEIKKDLLEKASRFQEIYNKITDTHESSLKVKPIKEDKAEFYGFSQQVLDARLSGAIKQSHFLNRIDKLSEELENFKVGDTNIPITSTEKRATDKHLEGLDASWRENRDTFSKADTQSIEKKINAIKSLTKAYQTSKETTDKKLYNTIYLKDAWKSWLESKKVYEKAVEDAQKEQDPNVVNLTPELKSLYDEATLVEDLSVGGVPYRATHKAKLGITITNDEGKKEQLEFTVENATKTGNLQLRQGNNTSNFLNKDGTLFTNNKSYKTKIEDVEILQSAEEIRSERQYQAMLDSLEQSINSFRNSINRIDKRIENGTEYIQDLLNKTQELEKKELNSLILYNTILTKKGEARKQSILLSRSAGKNVRQVYLTVKEIQDEVLKAKETLNELGTLKARREADLESRIKEYEEMKEVEGFDIEDLQKEQELIKFKGQQTTRTLNQYGEIIDDLESYIPKLRSTLRGYHTTAAKLLGVTNQVQAVRSNPNLSVEDKDQAVTDLIASEMLSAGEFTNEEYEQLFTLATNIDNINEKINNSQETISETQVQIESLVKDLNNLRQIFKENRRKLDEFVKEYQKLLSNLGVIVEQVSTEDKKSVTPEEDFKTLRKDEAEFISKYEVDPRHVFTGTVKDWFVSQGNQEYAKSIPEVARWFIFVNDLAYKEHRTKYKLKTVSYNFVGSLDKDNVIRRRIKFFTGLKDGDPVFKTYDEIQSLTPEEKAEATDDIKIIAINSKDSSPVLATEHGLLVTDDKKDHIFYTSMAAAREKTASDFTRKTTKPWEQGRLELLRKDGVTITDEQRTKIHEEAERIFLETLEEYKEFREKFKSDQSFEFHVTGINPGVKVKDGKEELDIEKATNKTVRVLTFEIPTSKRSKDKTYEGQSTLSISGIEYRVRPGFLYVKYKNRSELVKPKTFGETNDVDNIINLIKYMFEHTESAETIENYLRDIIFFNNESTGWRFFLKRPLDSKGRRIAGSYSGVVFGEEEISAEDLKEGKGIERLVEFLQNKYWNFDKRITSSKNEAYTEYQVVRGALKENKWTAKEGGYKAFLFSTKQGNTSKGTILIKPLPESGNAYLQTQDPQYINQSISFTQKEVAEQVVKKKPAEKPAIQPTVKPTVGVLDAYEDQVLVHKETGDKYIFKVRRFPTGKVTYKVIKEGAILAPGNVMAIKSMEQLAELFALPKVEAPPVVVPPKPTPLLEKPTPIEELPQWNDLKQAVKDRFIKIHGDEEAAKAVYDSMIHRNRGDLDRTAREIQAHEMEDISYAKNWFKQKFPDFPLHVVEGLIDNKSWGRLVDGSHVLLSSMAEHGTIYHEAFHVVSQIFLTAEERSVLYKEAKERLDKSKASDTEIEEILAEEFREFMISPTNYAFASDEKAKESWFNKLVKWIKQIIGNIQGLSNKQAEEKSIEQLFIGIKEGTFVLSTDRASYSKATYDRIKSLSNSESLAVLQDFNHDFFGVLLNPLAIEDNNILDFKHVNLKKIYDKLKGHFNITKQFSVPRKLPEIYSFLFNEKDEIKVEEWDMLVKEHIRHLKQYGIKATYTEEEKTEIDGNPDVDTQTDEDDRTMDTTIYRESITVNPKAVMPDGIRLLIAGLSDVRSPIFNTKSTVNFHKYQSLLYRRLAQITSIKEMISKIEDLSTDYPALKELLQLLGVNRGDSISNVQIELQNQFYKIFSLDKGNPQLTIMNSDGTRYSLNSMNDRDMEVTYNTWKNNALELEGEPDSFITRDTNGRIGIKTKAMADQLSIDAKITNEWNRATAFLNTFKRVGIVVTHDMDKLGDLEPINNYAKRLLEQLREQKGILPIEDLFNRDIIQSQKETKALIEKTLKSITNDEELSYFNQDGNQEWVISVPSHLSNTINRLNSVHIDENGNTVVPDEIRHLQPFDGKEGSLYSLYSQWWDNLEGNIPVELIIIKGHKTLAGKGKEIQKGTPGEYKSILFNHILENTIPLLRAADRTREQGIKSGETNSNISHQSIVAHMMDYMKGELITSFALRLKPEQFGGDLLYYKDRAKDFRTFEFLYDKDLNKKLPTTIEEFLSTSIDFNKLQEKFAKTSPKDILEPLNELVEQFVNENLNIIQTNISNYVESSVNKTLDSLVEDKVVTPTKLKTRTQNYIAPGINSEFFSTYGDEKTGRFTESQVKRMIKVANYNYFVGTQEQLKLIIGDIATFENNVAFHKRLKGVGSTKHNTRNDTKLIAQLNERWPMFMGEHSDTFGKTVVQDVTASNAELGKIFSEYNNIGEATDAQSWGTLDIMRSFLIRHGEWGNKEKTYQYEMQEFAIKLLDATNYPEYQKYQEILDIDDSVFTDEDGVFYKHTKGEVPLHPMYEGREIKIFDRVPIAIRKPMGYGPIPGVNLNATSYYKTSLAPIFLSALTPDNPMLEVIVRMMKNNIGVLNFHSSEKNTVRTINERVPELFNKNGSVNKTTLKNPQLMSWDDLGEQLAVHDDLKGKVTKSTQRARYEFLDIFNIGKLDKKDKWLTEAHNEFNYITNGIIGFKRRELFSELGVTETKDSKGKITYDLKDAEKFKERLIAAFENRLLPYNLVDGLDLALSSTLKVFDTVVNKNKIEEVLLAMVKNTLAPGKTKGELLVQESSVLYDEDLKFYSQNEDGSVNPMEVILSLPKEWESWVESIGGLNVFNDLIAANNTAILGDKFHELLKLPGVRIPAHGLNSMESMIIKKFLPSYHGPKIILPKEIVIKTGSDYDVDKMTVYFNHFTRNKKGKPEYIEEVTSIEGLENRYNKLISQTLLHGERFKELIKPTDSKTLEKLSKEVAKREGREVIIRPSMTELTEMPTNFNKAQEFWAGTAGVAFVTIQGTANATSQIYPIPMNPIVPVTDEYKGHIFFEGQELEEEEMYTSGHLEDGGGHKISTNIAEFLTAFVDAVKNPFIFNIANDETFGIYALLNRFGKDNGVNIESIAHFMTQDEVKEYNKETTKNRSDFLKYNGYNDFIYKEEEGIIKYRDGIFKDIFVKLWQNTDLSREGNYPRKWVDTVAYSVEQMLKYSPDSSKYAEAKAEIERKFKKYKYKYFSLKELKKHDFKSIKDKVQILDNYMMYQTLGWQLVNLNQVTRPDTGANAPKNLSDIQVQESQLDNIKERGLFDPTGIDSVLGLTRDSNAPLKEAHQSHKIAFEVFGQLFLTKKYPVIREYVYKVVQELNNPAKFLKKEDKRKILQELDNKLIAFMLTRMLGDTKTIKKKLNELFVGDNSVAQELLKLKAENKENFALNQLEPIIKQMIKREGLPSEVDNISTFNRGHNVFDIDTIVAGIEDLYNDPKTQKFARKLASIALFQSGLSTSHLSFLDKIPNFIFMPTAVKWLRDFVEKDELVQQEYLTNFDESFYQNMVNNPLIVPSMPYTQRLEKADQPISIRMESWRVNYEYLSARVFLRSRSESATLRKEDKRVPTGMILYKREISPDDATTPKINYFPISSLGDGFRITEFYPDSPNERSILAKNDPNNITKGNVVSSETAPAIESVESDMAADVSKAIKDDKRNAYSLEVDENIPEDEQLTALSRDFLKAIGISVRSVKAITDHKGNVVDAVAVANIANASVDLVQGKNSLTQLPEEAAHWYVELLGTDNAVYQSMMNNITKYKIYNEIVEKYSDIYEGNEQRLQKEAVGQLVMRHMFNEQIGEEALNTQQTKQVQTWWKGIWNFIKKLFGKVNLNEYSRAAYNIMNQRLEELRLAPAEVVSEESLYALEETWGDIEADKIIGNNKYIYYEQISTAETIRDRYIQSLGEENVTLLETPYDKIYKAKLVVQRPKESTDLYEKESITKSNNREYKKEDTSIEHTIEEILDNFEKYYPNNTWMNEVERRALVTSLSIGQMEQICGF